MPHIEAGYYWGKLKYESGKSEWQPILIEKRVDSFVVWHIGNDCEDDISEWIIGPEIQECKDA